MAQARRIEAGAFVLLVVVLGVAGRPDVARATSAAPGVEAASPSTATIASAISMGLVKAEPLAVSEFSAGTSCTPEFGSFSTGQWPPACWRPYGPTSPFNVPIPENPTLASESSVIIKYINKHHWFFPNISGRFALRDEGSRPVYWGQASDPLVKVICRGRYPCQTGMQLHIPAGAKPEAASDGHMTVVEQASDLEYDFWQATTPAHGEMTVSAGNSIPIGPSTGTGLGGVAEAARLGLLGGLIRAPELTADKIEHALAITVKCVQTNDIWPSPAADKGDKLCSKGRAGPHFGSLLQLDMTAAEIAATGAPAWQQAIMLAMDRYGLYVVDTNGSRSREMSLIEEEDQSFTSFGYAGEMSSFIKSAGGTTELVGVPIETSKLRVIASCVPERTC